MKAAFLLIGASSLLTIVVAMTLLGPGSQQGVSPADTRWWRDAQQLTADDTADNDHFGRYVALDGNVALIGAPLNNAPVTNAGAAYLFRHDRSAPIVKLGSHEATLCDQFGESVALLRRTALVGKPGDDYAGEDAGAAYLYQEDGPGKWNRVAKLVAADAAAGDQFGNCVALDEGIALIATRGKQRSGAVYLFQEGGSGNWRQVAKWTSEADASEDYFGFSITVRGNLAVVGAHANSSEGYKQAGAAYLFQRDAAAGWKQVAKLTAPEIRPFQIFGRAVALYGETVLVGAPGHDNHRGTVYLFQEDSAGAWQPVTQLTPHDAMAGSHFGHAVAMSGGMIAVGAPVENQAAGAVYLFEEDATGVWRQIARLTLPGRRTDNWFGSSLALSGEALLVGAHFGRGNTPKSGAAYLFRLGKKEQMDESPAGYALDP